MAKHNKGQNQPKPNAVDAKPSNPAPAIDVLGATDAKAGEGAASAPPSPPVAEEKKEAPATYREHQSLWESKAEKAAKAGKSAQPEYVEPCRKTPAKYRKFQNLKEK